MGYHGALKNMMYKGDISAKADLADYRNIENFYALGAVENLKGEIQIFNSRPFITIVKDSEIDIDSSWNKKATLLVYAIVPQWTDFSIPPSIITNKQLETFIELTARQNGMDTDQPFPFLINGSPTSFDWHVINWKNGDMEHSHEKHIRSGLYGTIKDRKVSMLGFYSVAHKGIFTHHTTNMHIHFQTEDNVLAGHVDKLALGEGLVLKLPRLE